MLHPLAGLNGNFDTRRKHRIVAAVIGLNHEAATIDWICVVSPRKVNSHFYFRPCIFATCRAGDAQHYLPICTKQDSSLEFHAWNPDGMRVCTLSLASSVQFSSRIARQNFSAVTDQFTTLRRQRPHCMATETPSPNGSEYEVSYTRICWEFLWGKSSWE